MCTDGPVTYPDTISELNMWMERDVCADLSTRYTKGYRTSEQKSGRVVAFDLDSIPRSWAATLLDRNAFRHKQGLDPPAQRTRLARDGNLEKEDKTGIPSEETQIRLKFVVRAHFVQSAHRERPHTEDEGKEMFWWDQLRGDMYDFVQSCVYIISPKTGEKCHDPFCEHYMVWIHMS